MRANKSDVKIFGSNLEGFTYIPRPAAYAVIRGVKRTVAVVKTSRGYFLPGGGSLLGELPEDTLHREVREELACEVKILGKIGTAIQYFAADGQHYRMEAVFFEAELIGETSSAGESTRSLIRRSQWSPQYSHQRPIPHLFYLD